MILSWGYIYLCRKLWWVGSIWAASSVNWTNLKSEQLLLMQRRPPWWGHLGWELCGGAQGRPRQTWMPRSHAFLSPFFLSTLAIFSFEIWKSKGRPNVRNYVPPPTVSTWGGDWAEVQRQLWKQRSNSSCLLLLPPDLSSLKARVSKTYRL